MLLENAKEFMQELYDTLERKNHDYAGGEDYKNFELVEKLGICSADRGILVRMIDKLSRLTSLLGKEAKVKDETVIDTLKDLAGYAIILASLLKDKNNKKDEVVKHYGFTRKKL